MILPLARSLVLFVCTLSSFAVLGRAPGAITLRTRDLEVEIVAGGKSGREVKGRHSGRNNTAWLGNLHEG